MWYQLELNESMGLDSRTSVTRVPGGWVMESSDDNGVGISRAMCFIPFNNEFMTNDHRTLIGDKE